MYVARDKDGDLYLYKEKPVKNDNWKSWQSESDNHHDYIKMHPVLLPEVKWEDEEPTEVELVKKEEQPCQ